MLRLDCLGICCPPAQLSRDRPGSNERISEKTERSSRNRNRLGERLRNTTTKGVNPPAQTRARNYRVRLRSPPERVSKEISRNHTSPILLAVASSRGHPLPQP